MEKLILSRIQQSRVLTVGHRLGTLLVLCLVTALTLGTPHTTVATEDSGFPPPPLRPDELLREGIDRLTDFLSTSDNLNPNTIHSFLNKEIAPYFDFAYMARWAAGSLHRRLSETQRQAMVEHLRTTFLSALARNLGSFAEPPPHIDISAPVRGRSENEIAVYAKVKWTQGFTIRLEFRFYSSPNGWKIFDVAANGASAVGYYRRYYTEQLRRHGPKFLLSVQ